MLPLLIETSNKDTGQMSGWREMLMKSLQGSDNDQRSEHLTLRMNHKRLYRSWRRLRATEAAEGCKWVGERERERESHGGRDTSGRDAVQQLDIRALTNFTVTVHLSTCKRSQKVQVELKGLSNTTLWVRFCSKGIYCFVCFSNIMHGVRVSLCSQDVTRRKT